MREALRLLLSQSMASSTTWAANQFEKDPTKIFPIVAYLFPDFDEFQVEVNEFDIQEFADRVKTETEEMYQFCSNIEENIPRDKEQFVKTPNTKLCNYCNFGELCFN